MRRKLKQRLAPKLSRLGARFAIETARPYQPIPPYRPALDRPDAAFHERWRLMATAMRNRDVHSFCDLGCAEGFFVRRAARELGVFSVGVERDESRLRLAAAAAHLDGLPCSIVRMDISGKTIEALPTVDAIACLSLLHHIIEAKGIEEGRAVLAGLCRRVRKCLFFEMGTPAEPFLRNSQALATFAGDAEATVGELLRGCGFAKIEVIGQSQATTGNVSRPLFCAAPAREVPERTATPEGEAVL